MVLFAKWLFWETPMIPDQFYFSRVIDLFAKNRRQKATIAMDTDIILNTLVDIDAVVFFNVFEQALSNCRSLGEMLDVTACPYQLLYNERRKKCPAIPEFMMLKRLGKALLDSAPKAIEIRSTEHRFRPTPSTCYIGDEQYIIVHNTGY